MKEPLAIARVAINALKEAGADRASCAAAVSDLNELNAVQDGINLLRTTHGVSLTLTAIKDDRRGTVTVTDADEQAIKAAAKDCLEAARNAKEDKAWDMCSAPCEKHAERGEALDLDNMYARTAELMDGIRKEYPRIVLEALIASHRDTRSVYLNSHGVCYTAHSGRYSVGASFLAREQGVSSSFSGISFSAYRLDKPLMDMDGVREALADCEKQIFPVPAKGKFTGTVVFSPGCLTQVFSSLLENFAADHSILDGTSIWKDKLGRQVADERITLSSRPLDGRIVCGALHTAEGYESEDYDIIKNGVLNQMMLSGFVANKTGLKRAPNDDFYPVMQPGDTPLQDLIASIDRGLLIGYFSGGAPSISGEFSGVAKNSFAIRNGRIEEAVSETMISGNLADMLMNVRGISQETLQDGSSVMPWLAAGGITISGK